MNRAHRFIAAAFFTLIISIGALAPLPSFAADCRKAEDHQIRLSVGVPFITSVETVPFTTPEGKVIEKSCYYLNGDLTDYIAGFYYFLLSISGFVAMVMVMIAGAQWVFAAGDAGKITKAKERIGNAVVGIVILLFSYTMLYMVNPQLLELKRPEVKKVGEKSTPVAPAVNQGQALQRVTESMVTIEEEINNLSPSNIDYPTLSMRIRDRLGSEVIGPLGNSIRDEEQRLQPNQRANPPANSLLVQLRQRFNEAVALYNRVPPR